MNDRKVSLPVVSLFGNTETRIPLMKIQFAVFPRSPLCREDKSDAVSFAYFSIMQIKHAGILPDHKRCIIPFWS